ncbi:MAG: NapC/NirT family cytochrome c, partial [Tepidisphaeraceae bacterium]
MTETTTAPEKRPVIWTNPITLMGLLLAAAGLLLLVTFWLFIALSPSAENNQYLAIIGFMILPGVFINGLILCPVGMLFRKWRLQHHAVIKPISPRRAGIFLGITFFLILPVIGVSGYKGYHFTESAEFCGTICHNMDPQYVRYEQSPHARVTCAGCHIGPGASPFVKSKLSGLRQVFKTSLNTFSRPIPPAITELRPARDTCEQCHWPSHFFGGQLKKTVHFAPDETNTRHDYEVLVKVGGANAYLGQAEGIHMHMLDRIEYVSDDHRLDHIPWVRYRYPDGNTVVFRSDGKSTSEPPAHGAVRRLDCIDCHNLIGHDFPSPERAVDHALFVKRLDVSLPYIKRESVMVLAQPYKTREEGLAAIEKGLQGFYRDKYPEIWAKKRESVGRAVEAVRDIYHDTMFPEMKVDWRTYPNHIGHMESPGCFRCHDGLHIAEDGRRISSDCTSCHTFQYRQPGSPNTIIEKKFDHPMKINEAWTGLG